MKINKFMKLAIAEAKKGIKCGHGGPFGCVIVKDGKVIAKAHNQVLKDEDATEHGEMLAIRRASKVLKTHDLKGCVIYTTGYPCPMCMGAIKWANIRLCYFGCDVKETKKIGFRDELFYKNRIITKRIAHDECVDLYEEFNNSKNKKIY